MFTGIVEELGTVASTEQGAQGSLRLRITAEVVLDGIRLGDSTAVNGCCLTVVGADEVRRWWEADVSDETLRRTTLGSLRAGDRVNLERPLRLNDRLGGHIVQGHVDGIGHVVTVAPDLRVAVPPELCRYMVEKGSVTVDGVSLTVVDVDASEFSVAVIPHTMAVTTLGVRRVGDAVNIEVDVMAKYAEKLLAGHLRSAGAQMAPSARG